MRSTNLFLNMWLGLQAISMHSSSTGNHQQGLCWHNPNTCHTCHTAIALLVGRLAYVCSGAAVLLQPASFEDMYVQT